MYANRMKGSKLWQLSACSVMAFSNTFMYLFQDENNMTSRAYMGEVLTQKRMNGWVPRGWFFKHGCMNECHKTCSGYMILRIGDTNFLHHWVIDFIDSI